MSQDLCLNNSPLTMLVYWGGISSADATHLCTFDIPLISNIPNMVYLAPTNKEEYLAMLNWSIEQNEHPVAIRVPNIGLISTGVPDNTDYSILNKFKMTIKGRDVAIIGLGNFYNLACEVRDELLKLGINPTVINPKFITGLDTELLDSLKNNHKLVITLEDGEINGGFGEKISRFYGTSDVKVINYGANKEFSDRTPIEKLYLRYRLKKELIVDDVKKVLSSITIYN
jgi:1-deoxy-D-xylulose-5-phosphate synthase